MEDCSGGNGIAVIHSLNEKEVITIDLSTLKAVEGLNQNITLQAFVDFVGRFCVKSVLLEI